MTMTNLADRAMQLARIDRSERHPRPSWPALSTATVLAVAGSLVVDWALVHIGTTIFPSTVGYPHFHFSDYTTLTVIGVLIAGAAWPLVAWLTPTPRWLFLRLAIVVTAVLLLPDLYLLSRPQPVRAVGVLMTMHLAIAVVTYNALVRLAPPTVPSGRPRESGALPGEPSGSVPDREERSARRWATTLAGLVTVETVLGVLALVVVPTGRPTGWLPHQGTALYLAHALLGLPLTIGALTYLVRTRASTRIYRLSGVIGGAGVTIAGLGGVFAITHPLRLVGVALMLFGPILAAFGYLLPTFDRISEDPSPPSDG
jgi:hypothetical protein